MKGNLRTISALLRHTWAIEPVWADAYRPLVDQFLTGKLAGVDLVSEEEANRPLGYALDGQNCRVGVADGTLETDIWDGRPFADPTLPADSVAMIDIRGPIMKEGYCWSYGTEDYAQALEDVYANPNLIGAVLLMDSPGGQLSGTPSLFDQVIRPEKPVVGRIHDGMAASAGYWILSGCTYIYASQPTDQVGSIGVFVRLRDNSKALEMIGIEEVNVYSRLSADKNKPYLDALAGKPALLQDDLDEAARLFRQAVELGRGDRLVVRTDAEGKQEPFTGKVYYAREALTLGMIDAYGTVADAVQKVRELAASTATTTISNSNPTTAMALGFFHLTALQGVAASDITNEQLSALNAQLVDKNVTGVTAVRDTDAAQLGQMATFQARIKTLESDLAAQQKVGTQVTGLTATVTSLNEQVTTLTQERDAARTLVASYGAQPGSVASRVQKTVETLTTEADEVISETDAELRRIKSQLLPKTA